MLAVRRDSKTIPGSKILVNSNPVAQLGTWGWLPAISLSSAIAMFGLAIADTWARPSSDTAAPLLFWVSILILYVPTVVRMFAPHLSRRERVGLLILTGIGLYALKLFNSPIQFTFHDEFLHWRTVIDILGTGHLFVKNPLLTVSPIYPGLELVTAAIVHLSGLSVFEAGVIILGVGRVVLVISLYLFIERITNSPRIAGLTTLLYMANTNFVYFDAQFSYETLSLPLMLLALYAIAQVTHTTQKRSPGMIVAILMLLGAVTLTHHLTAYALTGILALWAILQFVLSPRSSKWIGIGLIALSALAMNLLWTSFAGNQTTSYLTPVLQGGVAGLIQLIKGEQVGRQLFQSSTGHISALWEQLNGIAAVGLTILAIPFGLFHIWRRSRKNAPVLVLGVIVLAYPVTILFRFISQAWEIASRASEFLFLGISLVMVIGFLGTWPFKRSVRLERLIFVVLMVIMFTGGLVSGWPTWARLPGPYIVSSDMRSVEPQGIADAQWAYTYLGPHHRMAADRINRLLMSTYGQQYLISHLADNVDVKNLYINPTFTPSDQQVIAATNIQFFVLDYRLTQGLSELGIYFEAGEVGSDQKNVPLPRSGFDKFDHANQVSRIFDSGAIALYAVVNKP